MVILESPYLVEHSIGTALNKGFSLFTKIFSDDLKNVKQIDVKTLKLDVADFLVNE